jgi:DNA-binding GntR family transcriptional regulator
VKADNVVETYDLEVSRSSRVPLYYQVALQLEREIVSGRYPPGERLPNEVDLASELSLSRPTLRQAIQRLVDKGLVVRKRGVGTLVVRSPATEVRRSIELSSLYDDLTRAGQRPTTMVEVVQMVEAPPEVAKALGVPGRSEVVHLRRIRTAADEPLALMTNYLPTGLLDLSREALEREGLYQLLRDAGINLRVATQTVGAKVASAAEARELGEPKGAALLTMTRIAYDDRGNAVEYGTHLYRASRYSFELTLVDR